MCSETGYAIRVWLALRAVNSVRAANSGKPLLLAFESARSAMRRGGARILAKRAADENVDLLLQVLLPKKLPFSDILNRHFAARAIRRQLSKNSVRVIHGQSHAASAAAVWAARGSANVRVVFDVHGVDLQERLNDGRIAPSSLRHKRAIAEQRLTWKKADHRLVVSQALGHELISQTGIPKEFQIVPCVNTLSVSSQETGLDRSKTRARLGFDESHHVVLYLGGSSPWQQPDYMIAVFRSLQSLNPAARLLVVTGDPDFFTSAIKHAGINPELFRVASVGHSEVPSVASAADIGILLRTNDIVNRVASPTKFAEYLAIGIPVLLSDVLTDFAQIVNDNGVGVVCGSGDAPDQVAHQVNSFLHKAAVTRQGLRDRCRAVAHERLSFQSVLPVYKSIYASHG